MTLKYHKPSPITGRMDDDYPTERIRWRAPFISPFAAEGTKKSGPTHWLTLPNDEGILRLTPFNDIRQERATCANSPFS